ncbi:MAG: Fic family protein [Candidatus Eremiobacteraeota bacterium]|nr:Fic family protein [Candidatus Eremiobacteraeota bacterium]MBV8498387.1 Fic family protein [Candidatus Eremiobacteraeota bacterium]
MASFQVRRWVPQAVPPSGLPRRARRGCDYKVYLPDPLAERAFLLDGAVAADVAQAELAVADFDRRARILVDTQALARLLLRTESVASSWIEGLAVGPRRLLRAAARLNDRPHDVTAADVMANVVALRFGTETVRQGGKITLDLILEIHRFLLQSTLQSAHAGKLRTVQNWIGSGGYNPCDAVFVPPPPDLVESLMRDLCAFCNADVLPAVAQAAIAHAQFENIHPFADGNGRVGRALIHLILRRRGLSQRTLPPISLVLASSRDDYFAALRASAYVGKPESAAAREAVNAWVERFALTTSQAVGHADSFEKHIDRLEIRWRKRLGRVRAGSAVDLLLRHLPQVPILTAQDAADVIGRSFEAANNAIAQLVGARVLTPQKETRRNRTFEASELLTAFADFERRLTAP